MKVLVLDLENGDTKVIEENEVTQEQLQGVDEATVDIIRAVRETTGEGNVVGYERVAVNQGQDADDDVVWTIAGWVPL